MAATELRVFIADTECTGVDPAKDQVVELAMMDLPSTPEAFMKAKLEDLPMMHSLYGHDVPMSLGALAAHGIPATELEGKPKFDRVNRMGKNGAGESGYMIGHNVDFDSDFLDNQGCKHICTLALARYVFPDLDSHTQSAVLLHIGRITKNGEAWALDLIKGAHRADADVMNCARVLKYLIFMISKGKQVVGGLSWEDIYQVCMEARVPKIMTFGKFKGLEVQDVEPKWAEWYAGQENADKWVLTALRRAGVLTV